MLIRYSQWCKTERRTIWEGQGKATESAKCSTMLCWIFKEGRQTGWDKERLQTALEVLLYFVRADKYFKARYDLMGCPQDR